MYDERIGCVLTHLAFVGDGSILPDLVKNVFHGGEGAKTIPEKRVNKK
jgi:hypothetical protein